MSELKIIICGDISVTPESEEPFKKGDAEGAFGSICKLFKTADRTLVNLECAVTEHETGIKKIGPCLKGPVNTVLTLKNAGVTDCMLSNNHIFDFGKKGLYDTISELEKNELGYTGIGDNYDDSRKNLVIEEKGIKISVINVCEHEFSYATDNRIGARPFDEFETMDDIRKAKAVSDYVMVVYHGGKEYCRYPSPRLLKACREMARCGANAVLCQHSHIIGTYECFEGTHILYGQGNFSFVEEAEGIDYNEGLLAEFTVSKETGISVKFIPVSAKNGGIDFASPERSREILSDMAKRNAEILNGRWREHWHTFCESRRRVYEAVRRGDISPECSDPKQMFSHYLDCEAHRDVWQELFKTWNYTNELET